MSAAMLVMTLVANEASKENHTVDATLVSKDEQHAVKVDMVESFLTVWDIPAVRRVAGGETRTPPTRDNECRHTS